MTARERGALLLSLFAAGPFSLMSGSVPSLARPEKKERRSGEARGGG
jgi:hypothetical protein